MLFFEKPNINKISLMGRRFLEDESGATAIEYALVITCIAVALVSTATVLGQNIINKIAEATTAVGEADSP